MAAACGSAPDEPPSADGASASTAWSCHNAKVPHGETLECTANVASAATSDGPAYYCAPGDLRGECPPPDSFANMPAQPGGDELVETCFAPNSPGLCTDLRQGVGLVDGFGQGTRGNAPTGATSDGTVDGFYCTHESRLRICRKVPRCDSGTHRLQMDCEPDQSSGLGSNSGPATNSGFPGGGTNDGSLEGGTTECFYPVGTGPGTSAPAATFQYVLETFVGATALHTRLTFNPTFVDNSYGATAVGWGSRTHKFRDLVGSDHAELTFQDLGGTDKLHFKLDYISASATAPSGYASLGVSGGEGRMILGNASSILKASSSLDRNLNERGYGTYLVDSPPTDGSFTAPASAPAWDYRVVYEAWIDAAAFGPSGYGKVQLSFVHASPSKASSNTLPVESGPCPPGWASK